MDLEMATRHERPTRRFEPRRTALGGLVVDVGSQEPAKVRPFWAGLLLAVLTLGLYHLAWYMDVNCELRDIGEANGDQSLARSRPGLSVLAFFPGALLIVPPFVSVDQFNWRIQAAEAAVGVPANDRLRRGRAFVLYLLGSLLLVPLPVYYWYVTKHHNATVRAAAAWLVDN